MTKTVSPAVLKKLAAVARKARDNAYAPYSKHPVGAALLSSRGNVYAGANSEAAHYKNVCGERAAIAAMITAGERKIRVLAILGPATGKLTIPCGNCRQDIREFAGPDTRVYSLKKDGSVGRVYTVEELLPDSFGPENMARVGAGPKAKKARVRKK